MLRRLTSQEGFTLIELMVVVLIIAILVAIAIPAFLGMRNRGYDAQARSNLRNGVTAAQTYFTDNERYTGMNSTTLSAIESNLAFGNAADRTAAAAGTDFTVYVVGAPAATTAELACPSQSGTLFIASNTGTGWTYTQQ